MKLSIVVPTYNECGGIARLIAAVSEVFAEFDIDGELIVVDDNSPDGTGSIVDALTETYPVRCLHRPGKLGLSSGVIDGWNFARKESEALGVMDADFSHDPQIIPALVKALKDGDHDLAVGSRYVSGGGIENWPKRRIITSRAACLLARPLTSIRDVTSGFFLVRRGSLDGINLNPIGFKIGLEVFSKAHYKNPIEVPYTFRDREVGVSKLGAKEIGNYLKQLYKLYLRKYFQHSSIEAESPSLAVAHYNQALIE